MNDTMETKDILKTLRKARGYTSAKDFCKAIGISFSTYQNYESGSRVPTVEMLIKIADFYGVTTDFLLGREPVPKPLADLNLSEENEIEVIDKYMSLPPNVRAFLMDVLVKLGEIAKSSREQEQTVKQSTTLGTLEDQMEEAAKTKEEASS